MRLLDAFAVCMPAIASNSVESSKHRVFINSRRSMEGFATNASTNIGLPALHARAEIENWRREYNEERPKKALGGLTPAAHAKQLH
jgi:transposase InsO family protein